MKARSLRQTLHRVHGWLGVYLFSVLAVVFLSGTLAVFGHELDWLLNDDIRATRQSDAPLDWSGLERSVRRAYPEASVDWLIAPVGPGYAAQAWITTPDEQTRRVYLHPDTHVVQGDSSFFNAQRFLRSLHYSFFTNNVVVLAFIAALGFVLLFSLVSGLVIYRRFWRGLLKWPHRARRRAWWGELHRLVGVWLIPFSLLIAVTSIWYFAEVVAFWIGQDHHLEPPLPTFAAAEAAPCTAPVDAGGAARIARAAFPGLEVTDVIFPYADGIPIEVRGDASAVLTRARANAVHIQPCTGEVLGVQDGAALGALHRFGHMADPLHFGNFAGLVSKTLWFVFGLGLSGSLFSGAYIWWQRMHKDAAERRRGRRIAALSLLSLGVFCGVFGTIEIAGYLGV